MGKMNPGGAGGGEGLGGMHTGGNNGASKPLDDLKNSFLGEFLNLGTSNGGDIVGKHDDADEYMIMSGSEEDEEMAPLSSDDDALSFGS